MTIPQWVQEHMGEILIVIGFYAFVWFVMRPLLTWSAKLDAKRREKEMRGK